MDRSTQIKALASETRLEMLRLLAEPARRFAHQWSADPVAEGVCMSLIAQALSIAQPTASKHLEILRQAGFLTVRRRHRWSYCKRDDTAIREYLDWLGAELSLKA